MILDWSQYEPYFVRAEFTCPCGCGRADMKPRYMDRLFRMRDAVQFPFVIRSGFRCPEHNNRVSSTGFDGPHTTGCASDVALSHYRLYAFWKAAYDFGFTGHGHGEHRGFGHLDDLTEADGERFAVRPNAWTYGR